MAAPPYVATMPKSTTERGRRDLRAMADSSMALEVNLDLAPLGRALKDLGPLVVDRAVVRGLNAGIKAFKSEAHTMLKGYTKIKTPSRLKRGVRILQARSGNLVATYIIRDTNIGITKARFGATFAGSPSIAALVRWHKYKTPSLTQWTSWDGSRTRGRPFMLKGKGAVFVHLHSRKGKGIKGSDIEVVRGPNPAELVRIHAPAFARVLAGKAQHETARQIKLGYQQAVGTVKARHGL